MNCSDRIYHKNDFGSSRKCECNSAVHVTFGNISLLLGRSQVSDLATYIAETVMSEYDVEDLDARCIYIPTRDYCLMFALSHNELKALSEILDQTLLMMEIDDALALNNQP